MSLEQGWHTAHLPVQMYTTNPNQCPGQTRTGCSASGRLPAEVQELSPQAWQHAQVRAHAHSAAVTLKTACWRRAHSATRSRAASACFDMQHARKHTGFTHLQAPSCCKFCMRVREGSSSQQHEGGGGRREHGHEGGEHGHGTYGGAFW